MGYEKNQEAIVSVPVTHASNASSCQSARGRGAMGEGWSRVGDETQNTALFPGVCQRGTESKGSTAEAKREGEVCLRLENAQASLRNADGNERYRDTDWRCRQEKRQ